MTAEKPDRQANYETVVHDSSGLSLRTRTISSTSVPTLLQKSTVSAASSVRSNCYNSAVNVVPRPRGRPPKNVNRIVEKKLLKRNISKHSEKTKIIDLTSTVIQEELASSSLECLQEQLVNKSTGFDNFNDKVNKEPPTDVASINIDVSTNVTNLSLTSEVDKNKECIVSCKKKNNTRKRKQSSDIGEIIAGKCILISDNSNDSLMPTNNESVPSTSTYKRNIGDNVLEYGFLAGRDIESYRQRTDLNVSSTSPSIFYGRTYWPVNWEYSAAALTSHIQKKVSKDTLRKIRLICNAGGQNTPLLKTSQTLKKYQTPIVPRRGSASKLTSSLASVEISNGVRHHPALTPPIVKRIGRPPGKRNKLLQAVIKSNSPRKSPRQHASTLAAIMSKVINPEVGTQQFDKIIAVDIESKDSLDANGPCVLTAMPKHDEKPEVRHYRRRRQLDRQRGTIKSRKRRSITPTPPKLCAQQPISQRTPINGVAIDHEIVKLRTKHVDIIKRRGRDEGVRTNYICQQLRKVQEVAEQNRRDLSQEVVQIGDAEQESGTAIILSSDCSEDFWSSLTTDNNREPDNMCLQIMYEQTGDKKFLCTELTDDTVKMYHQQRDLILAECPTNNNSNFMSRDLSTDIISASNKRKKKRPNMTGWPKEKRKKTIITTASSMTRTVDINSDSDVDIIVKRKKAAEQQRLRRRRIKLEQQKLSKEKSVTPKATPKRPGRRPNGKNKTATYRRSKNLNNTPTSSNKVNEKKSKIQKRRQQRIQNKTEAEAIPPTMGVKKNCGRPKGSIGVRQKLKLQLLQQRQNQTSLSSEQQKENIGQPTTSGKLKCVISTRNNRMKLLTSSSSSENLSRKRTLARTKKSTVAYNLSSSSLESLPSAVTVKGKPGKRRKLHHQESIATRTLAWDVGRPKRYHNSRNTSAGVEEEFCFVGSQPFEQHYPGVGGSSHNTVLENNQDQKENTINV